MDTLPKYLRYTYMQRVFQKIISLLIINSIYTTPAHAIFYYWDCGNGSWSNGDCWKDSVFSDPGVPPAGSEVFLSAGYNQNITLRLDIDNTSQTSFNRIEIDAERYIPNPATYGSFTLLMDNHRTLHTTVMEVGRWLGGLGIVDQSTGTNHSSLLYIGKENGGRGEYHLRGGTLSTTDEYVGYGGSGDFYQSGGFNFSQRLSIGHLWMDQGISGTGRYFLSNGVLRTDYEDIGEGSSGYFEQSGGTHDVDVWLTIHENGSYFMSGGELTVSRTETVSGHFLQDGGTHTAEQDLRVLGTYEMHVPGMLTADTISVGGMFDQGGQVNAINGLSVGGTYDLRGVLNVGNTLDVDAESTSVSRSNGMAIFNHRGGVHSITDSLIIGEFSNSAGTYNLSGETGGFTELNADSVYVGERGTGVFSHTGAANRITGNLYVGALGDSNGTYNISGSGAELYATDEYIGDHGTGLFNQYGLTNSNTMTGNLYVGYATNGNGTYNLINSALSSASQYIGHSGSGDFSQQGGTNTLSNDLYLGYNSGSSGAYAMISSQTSATMLDSANIYIGFGGEGVMNQSSGENRLTGMLSIGHNSGSLGGYTLDGDNSVILSAPVQYIGHAGSGSFVQNGGTNIDADTIYMGYGASGNGAYDLNNGSLAGMNQYIGYAGMAMFTQDGGSNTVTDKLYLGHQAGSQGTYALNGGTLVTNDTRIGEHGNGNFNQAGGFHNISHGLFVGVSSGSTGSYAMQSGSLDTPTENIGYLGEGSFLHSGGENRTDYLSIGSQWGGTGSYLLSGPDAQLYAGQLIVGALGSGSFEHTGGLSSVGSSLTLGFVSGTNGQYTLNTASGSDLLLTFSEYVGREGDGTFNQITGTHRVWDDLYIGFGTSGNGQFNLQGGELSTLLTSDSDSESQYVGYDGSGGFAHSGGSNTTDDLYLGYNASGTGTYDLSGTGVLTTAHEYIAYSGTGTVNHSGANNSTGTMYIGYNTGSEGIYNLEGGDLAAGTEFVGYGGTGTINHTSGVNTLDQLFIGGTAVSTAFSGSGFYNLGGSGNLHATTEYIGYSGPAVFNQSGGTNTVTGTLYVGTRSSGDYIMSDGNLYTNSEVIGSIYGGSFTQTGGINQVNSNILIYTNYDLGGTGSIFANSMLLGGNSGDGSFNQTGGTNTLSNDLRLGSGVFVPEVFSVVGGSGQYTLSNGNLTALNEYIGDNNLGNLNQTGGINRVTENLYLGSGHIVNPIGGDVFGDGQYSLSGGQLIVQGNEYLGNANGIATFNQNGGTNTANEVILVSDPGSNATYNLNDGELIANRVAVNENGVFNFNGGILSVENFEGDLVNNGGIINPGGSPGSTFINGDYFQIMGTLNIEIGGLLRGTEYDWLDVSGSATLGGALDASLFDLGSGLFNPSLGDSFDILSADTIVGEFDLLTLALLGDGLKWDVSYILDDFDTDFVRLSVSQVPVPAAVWLFGSGLLGLVGVARRKKA